MLWENLIFTHSTLSFLHSRTQQKWHHEKCFFVCSAVCVRGQKFPLREENTIERKKNALQPPSACSGWRRRNDPYLRRLLINKPSMCQTGDLSANLLWSLRIIKSPWYGPQPNDGNMMTKAIESCFGRDFIIFGDLKAIAFSFKPLAYRFKLDNTQRYWSLSLNTAPTRKHAYYCSSFYNCFHSTFPICYFYGAED